MNLIKKSTLFLVTIGLCYSCTTNKKMVKTPTSPNIVLMVVDDLGFSDMSSTGTSPDVQTPNIDAIAANGIRFTNAYATSSICSPSRAGLITGSYQQQWGTFWYGGPGIHNPSFKTIPELLKQKNVFN